MVKNTDREIEMKNLGDEKVWKDVVNKNGDYKNISSTQIGQNLLLKETVRVSPLIRDWINNKSHKHYRAELIDYFKYRDSTDRDERGKLIKKDSDWFLEEKILQTMLFMAGFIEDAIIHSKSKGVSGVVKTKNRHKRVVSLQNRVLEGLSFDNTWRFLEVLVDYSEYFFLDVTVESSGKSVRNHIKYSCSLSDEIIDRLSIESAQTFYPLPMTKPPIPWSFKYDILEGGYETYQYEMIRSPNKKVDYSKYSQNIFSAVNYIQEVPWIINKDVLEILKRDLKIPLKEDFVKSEYPDMEKPKWEINLDDPHLEMSERNKNRVRAERVKFKESLDIYIGENGDFKSAVGKYRAVKLAVDIAEKHLHDVIYFPHSYDFRGRVYPIPIGLSPQGSDAVKALLLYRDTKPLSKKGEKWAWAYLASLYGDDKLVFDNRAQRGKELLYSNYMDADEPYQFLSHQKEMQKWVLDNSYEPNLRIHLDACNSGKVCPLI